MQFSVVIIALVILGALAVASAFLKVKPATPDTPIKAVRSTAKRWTPYTGVLRDARLEGWMWAAAWDGEIISVQDGRRTGRVLRELSEPKKGRRQMKSQVIIVCCLLIALTLTGCITMQLPDGRTETRLDLPAIEAMLSSAILLYNVYATTEAQPEPSRLTELLDNVDRVLDIVNYVRVGQGLEPIEISKGATVEIVE